MRYLILMGILCLIFSCSSNNTVVSNKNVSSDKILQVSSDVNFSADVSELYEQISSVKLQIKGREFLESIDKIEIKQNKIFVLNRFGANAGLYAFDANSGRFLGTYGERNDGIGSYSTPYDFIVDEANNKMEMLTLGKILIFDLNDFEYLATTSVQYSAVRFKKDQGNYLFIRGGRQEPYFTFVNYSENKEYSFFEDGGPAHHNYPYNPFIEGYSDTYLQLNYCNQIYKITDNNLLEERYKFIFDGNSLDQDYVNSFQSPQAIREQMASSKIVKEFFFELKDHLYFSFVHDQRQFVKMIAKETGKEITYDVMNISNSVTNEKFPPFIINQSGNQLIAIKSLENDQAEISHDFEVFLISIKKQPFL